MNSDTVHIGVDVSKGKLDIYVPAKREGSRPMTKEVDNDVRFLLPSSFPPAPLILLPVFSMR